MGMVRRVTDAQVKELRLRLHQGASLKMAAMKAGMDRKSARKYQEPNPLPSESRRPRTWRTRLDPLVSVWPQLEEMLTREPELQAVTLLAWLQSAYPGTYPDSVRRTLERRVRIWKAQHGPAKEVFFAQVHEPGRLGASDFTHMNSLGVTIIGQPFDHLVYHFVLTHSNWEHVTVCFSESFDSLSAGMQNALWALGGVPHRHRTDRMTLAVHADGQAEEFTPKYQALLAHYGLTGEATNPASGHENGDCEQSHRRFKEALAQALLLRGSREFASRADYEQFLREVVGLRNKRRQPAFAAEASALRPLPSRRLETLECLRVRVGRGSTIQVRQNTYSVPARLRGELVEARLGVEEIEVWYAGTLVQRMPRLRGQYKHAIDYRHIIGWLVRKPGAFARYVYRADLYPTTTFRRAYDRLQTQDPERADKDYVQLLYLAAHAGESAVAAALEALLSAGARLSVGAVQARLGPEPSLTIAAQVTVAEVDLGQYDALLTALASLTDREQPAVGVREEERTHERDDSEPNRGSDALLDGAAPADDACRVRGGGAASDGGDVGLCRLLTGVVPSGVPEAAGEAHRAFAQGLEVAVGEELGRVGPEAFAGEGGTAIARAVERRLPGPAGERPGIWPAGFWEDALPCGGGPGTGAVRSAGAVHNLRPAGARPAGGQARLHAESDAEASGPLGRVAAGRSGLCAAEPRRDGSVVHATGGALRAWQRTGDEQPAVFEVGANLQGPDDDSSSGGSAGAPQRDRGVEHPELPCRGGQAIQAGGELGKAWAAALVRSGSASVALAALGSLRCARPHQRRGTRGSRGER